MNLHSTGNSEKKNQKWPALAILATATLLLSAISFIGVGAIPQPQQAFAQANVTQSNAILQSNVANVEGEASVTQSNEAIQSNVANVTGGSD
jgi:hypothetical protein